MTTRTPSIRTRLFILVVAAIMPTALMALALIAYNYQQERHQLETSTIGTARALGSALDQRLAEIQSGLTVLSSSRWLEEPDHLYFYARAAEVAQALRVTSISLIDPQGNQIFSTLQPLGKPLPAISPSSQIRGIFKTGQPVLVNLFTDPVTGKASVALGVPVLRNGQVPFAVVAGIAPELLRELLMRQQLPPNWVAGILDGNGTLVARTHEHERYLGEQARAPFRARIKEVAEDASDGFTLAGAPVLSVFSRAPRSQWTVAIGIPAAELTAGLHRVLLAMVAGTATLLAAALGLAGFQAGAIARSIRALMAQAEALGRGEPTASPEVEFREAHRLGEAFEEAAVKLKAALARSEGRLQAILESAMDAILAVNEDNRIVVFNAAATSLFGYSQAEALGMPLERLLPAAQQGHAAAWLEHMSGREAAPAAPAAGTKEQSTMVLRRDGAEFSAEAAVSSVRQGGETYHTVILRDITERLRTGQALVRSNLELQQFAFVASHDLRAPLRSIQGYLGLLEARHAATLDGDARNLIQRAAEAVRQLDGLTDDLLTYAQVDAQARPMVPVDCNQVLADTLLLLDAAISEAKAQVSAPQLPTVHGDRAQLVQLFQNLVGNALKYRGEQAPHVRITAQRGQHEWVFAFTDNGIGIQARHQERIFEVFKRLHTQQEYPGNGIGLAVCQRVVQRHGGRIWVTSEPGQGSTFFFSIPEVKGSS